MKSLQEPPLAGRHGRLPLHEMAAGGDIRGRRLRIAHVALGLSMGGLEKLLVEFARHADRERVALRFVSLGSRGSLADDIETCGWPVTALNEPRRLRLGLVRRLAHVSRGWV